MNKYLDKIGLELYHDLLQTELSHLADELNDVVIGKLIDNNFYIQENINCVEIGGIKWARMNVGANSITDTGLYFQWGDTQGYTADQVGVDKNFTQSNYKYYDNESYTYTKYNEESDSIQLLPEDDAVTAAWGGNWRTPTLSEYRTLNNAVDKEWTNDYQGSGVAGLICTDNTDSSKVLFFPACGYCLGNTIYYNDGTPNFDCWTSSGFT